MITLTHKISAVTVFENEAQITRTAQIHLEAGEHTLIFDDMPLLLQQKTLQVNGLGHATLTNVKYQKEYQKVSKNEQFEEWRKEKKLIENEILIIEQKIKRLQQERTFVENISQKVTSPSENNTQTELSPEKWIAMLDFYQKNLEKLDTQIWENTQLLNIQKEKLEDTKRELNKINASQGQTKAQIHISVEMHTTGELTLTLSYMLTGAGWTPVYDLRVDTQTKKMNITYNAFVRQETGEDWENIKLKLSTAKTSINGNQPDLSAWHIYLQESELNRSFGGLKKSVETASMPQMYNTMHVLGEIREEADEANIAWMGWDKEQERGITVNQASVDTKTSSVLFEIGGVHTLKFKDDKNKVTIFVGDFEAHFRYSCVPKLSTYAYLKAKVINNSEYPFLAGESNVFLDNSFVATAQMPSVAPTEDFWTFLGVDEGMKIEHKFLKKYETKETGFFSKKHTTWLYEYLIKIKSFKKQTEELVVFDQIPISNNSNIKVTLLEPPYKEDTDKLKKTDLNYLEWFFNIKSNEEITIPFKFSIEYPNDKKLSGI